MAFNPKHLARGEQIDMEMRTHAKAILGPILIAMVTIVIALAGSVWFSDKGWSGWLTLALWIVALIVLVWFVVVPVLRWLTTIYVITNRRLITRRGVISKSGRDIPLYRINDVSYEKGLLDRMLGCGTLVVHDATEQTGVRLYDVPRVEEVQVRLNELLFHHDDGGDDDGTFPPGDPRSHHGRSGY
ncbi:PH domain-containing protein [Rudaeicoccus suwonensis]|uniref:Membrane protein YdbS with pleckstrin-like domain n=1 Tax=Rudaeicoccus suwonensis TaxID=657409 RepID=A0A561EB08_9MICO|nr:PH domain-containing protein [Rudaeicoccus suwonensis]TWE12786.1 membrane protein YdbS with pleckstrin-like domain [Rudaeicoccus suwonensis]